MMNRIGSHAIERNLSYSCYKLLNGSHGTLPARRALCHRVCGEEHRRSGCTGQPVHVGREPHSIAHGHHDVLVNRNGCHCGWTARDGCLTTTGSACALIGSFEQDRDSSSKISCDNHADASKIAPTSNSKTEVYLPYENSFFILENASRS